MTIGGPVDKIDHMTRKAGEPAEDDLWRTSIALQQVWRVRLKKILDRKHISLPEQLRRWIVTEEWLTYHADPDTDQPLYIGRADGSYERVRLVNQ